MSKQILPGIEFLGYAYDVTGKYANEDSVDLNGKTPLLSVPMANWDPNTDPSAREVNIFGKTYYVPEWMMVRHNVGHSEEQYSSVELVGFAVELEASVGASGFYKAFKGELNANFKGGYTTSQDFFRQQEQYSRNVFEAGMPHNFKDLINPTALDEINGSMDADDLVAKYGAFFLAGGTYGGAITYGQAIEKYSVDTQGQAQAEVQGHFAKGLASGSLTSSSSVENKVSNTQSQAFVQSKGGNGDVSDLSAWMASVDEGKFALMNFKPEWLQPLSILADDDARVLAINAAIQRSLADTPPTGRKLIWDKENISDDISVGKGGQEKSMEVTDPREIIVGYAAGASSGNINRMAIRVLNMETNEMDWRTDDGSIYNVNHYEVNVNIPTDTIQPDNEIGQKHGFGSRAVALVGVDGKISSGGNNVDLLKGYYQILNPLGDGAPTPSFLGAKVNSDTQSSSGKVPIDDASNWQAPFNPGYGNRNVIVHIGIRDSDKKMGFTLKTAPLISEDADYQEQAAEVQEKLAAEEALA